ncbi:fumarate hydratase, partial [Myxococcota bacterium]|nr:fumarate hydratase [Myxococcota bacterium]
MTEFFYQDMFPLGPDATEYRHLGTDGVRTEKLGDKEVLVIDKEVLSRIAKEAMHDVSFFLRSSHNEQVAKILGDPEASANDRFVATAFLKNAVVSAKGQLPVCQDTGTAIVMGKKGENVFTGANDAEALSKGIFTTYADDNLRYSQNAPLDMYK